MNLRFLLPSLFLGIAFHHVVAQTCVAPPSGLVSWWAAEGNANDETGANHGVLQNGVAFTGGEVGTGFSFDGLDDYVSVAAASSLNVGAGGGFTIEGWINPGNLLLPQVIAEWNNGAGGIGVHFMHSIGALGGSGSLFANVVDSSGGSHYFATSANVLVAGVMQHVALTYDRNSGEAKIFLNGVASAGVNVGTITPETTFPLNLGSRISGDGSGSFFQGAMDELCLYNRALSDSEILALFNAGTAGKCKAGPPTISVQPTNQTVAVGATPVFRVTASGLNLRYQWLLNGNVVTNATNATLKLSNVQLQQAGNYSVIVSNDFGSVSSSIAVLTLVSLCVSPAEGLVSWWPAEATGADLFGGNNASLSGGLSFTNGKVGQAFSFDGLNDCAAVPAGTADVGDGDGFTAECWLKPANVTTAHALIEWNNGATEGVQLWTSIPALGGPGSLFANITQDNGTSHILASAANILNTANFQHIALTYNRTSGVAKLYRNGGIVASKVIGSFRPQTTYALNFGKRISGTAPSYYQGAMDEVGLYTRALTEAEVLSIYLADTNGKSCLPPEILVQPVGKVVLPGSNVTFSADIRGSLPMTYQWWWNGSMLPGETNVVLTVSNAQPSKAGNYALRVTNVVGFTVSANAVLKVNVMSATGNGQPLTNTSHSFSGNVTVQLQNAYPGGQSFYTLDGTQPTFASAQYTGPFVVSSNFILRALGYSPDFFESGELGPIAILLPPSYQLTVATGGGGTVSLNPPTGPYLSNSVVTLTATPNPGWQFLQWLGDASGNESVHGIIMNRSKSIQAVFGTLLNTTAAGGGAVTLTPSGGVYPYGATVRLSAIPNAGNQFALWGSAASGNVNPLNFTVTNANPTVSSLFVTVSGGQAALTVVPVGLGEISVNPRANAYATGTSVSIIATPATGQTFLNWSGDANGTQNPLSVAMDQNKLIYAHFTAKPQLSGEAVAEGFRVTLTGDYVSIYQLESSTNLTSWTTVSRLTNFTGTVQYTDPTTGLRQYYRALKSP